MGKLDKETRARSRICMAWAKGASCDDFELLLNFESLPSHMKGYTYELNIMHFSTCGHSMASDLDVGDAFKTTYLVLKETVDLKPLHCSVYGLGIKLDGRCVNE